MAIRRLPARVSGENWSRSFLKPSSGRNGLGTCSSLDDLGLHRLTGQQSADLYELIVSRHRVSSFVIASNRAMGEWLSLFDDPILGNSALDRLANSSYQIVMGFPHTPKDTMFRDSC